MRMRQNLIKLMVSRRNMEENSINKRENTGYAQQRDSYAQCSVQMVRPRSFMKKDSMYKCQRSKCISSTNLECSREFSPIKNMTFDKDTLSYSKDNRLKIRIVKELFLDMINDVHTALKSEYSSHLKKFKTFELTSLVLACILFRRSFSRSSCNIYAFVDYFLACNVIAFKYKEDYCVLNSRILQGWPVPLKQMNYFEAKILSLLKYDLNVPCEGIKEYIRRCYMRDLSDDYKG